MFPLVSVCGLDQSSAPALESFIGLDAKRLEVFVFRRLDLREQQTHIGSKMQPLDKSNETNKEAKKHQNKHDIDSTSRSPKNSTPIAPSSTYTSNTAAKTRTQTTTQTQETTKNNKNT